jgi:hypothetical protein
MKNDDYLWDGSGEADPDVERLEGLLGRYRSERPAPAMPETPVVPFRPRRTAFVPYAAAAALVLGLTLAIAWMVSQQGSEGPKNTNELAHEVIPTPIPVPPPSNGNDNRNTPLPAPKGPERVEDDKRPQPKQTPRKPKAVTPAEQPVPDNAHASLRHEPLVDLTTAMHIDQAEMLLRSFRNAEADDESDLAEIALDTRQSRDLLQKNVILRRGAQNKKNLAVGTLLGDLEPVLAEIASLGDRPSREDVRAVQQRIEQREIVSDLQLYSSNSSAKGF